MSVTIRKRLGMTLMELMVVMVIIGILVGLTVPATLKLRSHATATKERSARLTLRNAVLSFHAHYGMWPVGNQSGREEFTSKDVIKQLRPGGTYNTQDKIFWEGEDEIKSASGLTYYVVINPLGMYPIQQGDGFETDKKVYFLLK
jgi:prepilin-type N-terminal cleavage/methylation domain-containing protein